MRGSRQLDLTAILEGAIAYTESVAPNHFNLRGLARHLQIDPSSLCYHFGNKAALKRAVVRALLTRLQKDPESGPWQFRLKRLALDYRKLAKGHPNSFSLLSEHPKHALEPSLMESWFSIFTAAGFSNKQVRVLSLAACHSLIGLCLIDIGYNSQLESALQNREPDARTRTRATRALATTHSDDVFRTALCIMIAGIEALRSSSDSVQQNARNAE